MSIFHGGIVFPMAEGSLQAKPVARCRITLPIDCPTVSVGDLVARGQEVGKIADRPRLSGIAGKVAEIADGLLMIDPVSPEEREKIPPVEVTPFGKRTGKTLLEATPAELLEEIARGGIEEGDGQALVNRLRSALELSRQGKLRMAAVSLLEPDPASISYSSLGLELAREIAGGLAILLRLLSLPEGVILCDKAQPQVVMAVREAVAESRLIAVDTVENRYPLHHPKLLTHYFSGKELSPHSTPEASGVFLIDAECCAAIHQLFATGIPRLSVRVTLWEGGIARAYDLPIGMELSALWDLKLWKLVPAPEKESEEKKSLVKPGKIFPVCQGLMNGGHAPRTVDRSLTVLTPSPALSEASECIRCGRCAEVCSMFLHPYRFRPGRPRLNLFNGNLKDAAACIGCGACSYICPSRIPLRHFVLRAKQEADLSRKV